MKRLDEESKKPASERRPPEFGSEKDFPLQQALNQLQGKPVKVSTTLTERKLDEGIVAARWLTLGEVKATQARHRSPLILRCIEDLLAGKRYPLDLLMHYD